MGLSHHLCMLPPPRYWGSESRENFWSGSELKGGMKGREILAKIQVQLLLSCVSPQTRQLWKQGSDLFSRGVRNPSSFSLHGCYKKTCKLYIPEAGQCAEQSRSRNYTSIKCNPAITSPYQLGPVDAQRLLCCCS